MFNGENMTSFNLLFLKTRFFTHNISNLSLIVKFVAHTALGKIYTGTDLLKNKSGYC